MRMREGWRERKVMKREKNGEERRFEAVLPARCRNENFLFVHWLSTMCAVAIREAAHGMTALLAFCEVMTALLAFLFQWKKCWFIVM